MFQTKRHPGRRGWLSAATAGRAVVNITVKMPRNPSVAIRVIHLAYRYHIIMYLCAPRRGLIYVYARFSQEETEEGNPISPG
jgi:hypothetical protein